MRETFGLLKIELLSEWRNKSSLSSAMLYVVATVFVCYLSFKKINDSPVWNALYWIIILFTAVNSVSRSFSSITKGQWLYLYTLTSPGSFILSKMIFNSTVISSISVLTYLIYSILAGNPVQNSGIFVVALVAGSTGIGSLLSLMGAIASKAGNNVTLMTVLSFPVILPLLTTLIRLTKACIDNSSSDVYLKYLGVTGCLDIIVLVLGYILFPYLWRD